MIAFGNKIGMNGLLIAFLAVGLAARVLAADNGKEAKSEAPVVLILGPGRGCATPLLHGCSARSGAGNIHITQPAADTISVIMTGGAVVRGHLCKDASAAMNFELAQCFEVVFNDPKVKSAKLILWGRQVGLLRSAWPCCGKQGGAAEICTPARATVTCADTQTLALELPPRMVAGGLNLSVHDREGPIYVPVTPGKYTLHQVFGISASHGHGVFCKPTSVEFAPESLEGDWLGQREPFHKAEKKDFGFHVILKVAADGEAHTREP